MKRRLSTILFGVVFIAGLSLLLYPTVSDYWNSFHQSRAIASYVDAVDNTDEQKLDEMRKAAQAYNEKLLSKQDRYEMSDQDKAEYESLLDVSGTGVMGYVEIPSINVSLPIYHGTDNTILQIGVGHIEGTSLPVGGASTHCAVSGHRGLTSSKLFTDIDQMAEGDTFKLYVLGETLTYEVDQIRIVLPDELNDLKIEEGQDYCTLITCTPYGVNSHRLLIRGHRIANDAQGLIVEDVKQVQPLHEAIVLGILFLVLYSLKRAVSIAIAAIALFSLPCGSIFARTHIDIDKKCSITVDIPDTWEDLYTVDFPVELYRVADVDENDVYTATKQFDELAKSISDISSKTTADDWEKMAKTAADIADKGSLTADEAIDVSNGRGNVTGVKTGLYLVYAKPANSARFGYTFVPYLISAPNNEFAMTGSGSDSWIYDDIDIELKPEQTGLMGSLQINKTLKTYNTALGEPVFAFDVEAYDRDGNVVFSDIASIRFDSTGAKSVVIDNIPAGSRVIVKEVYAAGSYQVTSSDSIETQIVAGETADVDFTNDYNDKLIYSTGVVNHFEYDGTGWEWVQN